MTGRLMGCPVDSKECDWFTGEVKLIKKIESVKTDIEPIKEGPLELHTDVEYWQAGYSLQDQLDHWKDANINVDHLLNGQSIFELKDLIEIAQWFW